MNDQPQRAYGVEPVTVDATFATQPEQWLANQAAKRNVTYLLANGDDGIIWGRVDGGVLRTGRRQAAVDGGKAETRDVTPALQPAALHQCRLFGDDGELRLWRDEDGWHGCWIAEAGAWTEAAGIEEEQVLWGTEATDYGDGFTLLTEGRMGMRHVVPIKVSDAQAKARTLRLVVRHYIDVDAESGEATIAVSRLVTLKMVAPKEQKGGNHGSQE